MKKTSTEVIRDLKVDGVKREVLLTDTTPLEIIQDTHSPDARIRK